MTREDSSRSAARPGPTIRGSSHVTPYSPASPRRAKAVVNRAFSAANRTSQASASTSPMPAQAPFTAAMIGLRNRQQMRRGPAPGEYERLAGDLVQPFGVHARAERLARAGHDDDAHRRVGVDLIEHREEPRFQCGRPAVAPLGPVQRDECDRVAVDLEQDTVSL